MCLEVGLLGARLVSVAVQVGPVVWVVLEVAVSLMWLRDGVGCRAGFGAGLFMSVPSGVVVWASLVVWLALVWHPPLRAARGPMPNLAQARGCSRQALCALPGADTSILTPAVL